MSPLSPCPGGLCPAGMQLSAGSSGSNQLNARSGAALAAHPAVELDRLLTTRQFKKFSLSLRDHRHVAPYKDNSDYKVFAVEHSHHIYTCDINYKLTNSISYDAEKLQVMHR